jgi:hypothetical protein
MRSLERALISCLVRTTDVLIRRNLERERRPFEDTEKKAMYKSQRESWARSLPHSPQEEPSLLAP